MSFRIEPLKRHHDRLRFCCGDDDVDLFLREKAMQNQKLDLSRTSVLVEPETDPNRILGFHTLLVVEVPQENLSDDRPKIKRNIPVILLGQLGVDRDVQGRRFGEKLLLNAQETLLLVSKHVGIRAMALDARDEPLSRWYAEHGFLSLDSGLRMSKRTETIRFELG